MYHYETKLFLPFKVVDSPNYDSMDEWLNSLTLNDSKGYSNHEIVGYVSNGAIVIITVKIWESKFNKKDGPEN